MASNPFGAFIGAVQGVLVKEHGPAVSKPDLMTIAVFHTVVHVGLRLFPQDTSGWKWDEAVMGTITVFPI